jgi:acetylornithine aminotransferase
VLEIIHRDGLIEHAAQIGERLLSGFRRELAGVNGVREIRGRGLMLGIELDRPCADVVRQALAAGLLINVTADRVVRLLPPLILEQTEADRLIGEVSRLVRDFLASPALQSADT